MPRTQRIPRRYDDVVAALSTRWDDVYGWSYLGPDEWRIWPNLERWSHRPAIDGARLGDPGDAYTDDAIRALLGIAKPSRKTRAVAAAERDAAMSAVDGHASDAAWRAWVWQWIAGLNTGVEFIGDDVWQMADARGIAPPHDPRALGPLIKRAQHAGIIEATGVYRQSPRRHLSPVMVWRRTSTPALAHALDEAAS